MVLEERRATERWEEFTWNSIKSTKMAVNSKSEIYSRVSLLERRPIETAEQVMQWVDSFSCGIK